MTARRTVLAAVLLALAGCVGPNMAPLVEAMGKDPANVCVHIGAGLYTPEITVSRVNGPGVASTCMTGAISTMPTAGTGTAIVTFPGQVTVAPITLKQP